MIENDFSEFGLDDFSAGESFGAADTDTQDFESSESAPEGFDPRLPNGAGIAVVDSDQSVREYLAAQLGEGAASAGSLEELEPRLGMSPVVVVLGPSCTDPSDLARIESWSRTNPEVGSVLVTNEMSTDLLRSALRAGVKDVLSAPIDQMQLIDTVNRVAEGLSTHNPGLGGGFDSTPLEELDGDPGRVVTIFSTKGGSGKSVTASNVAVALAKRSDRPVVLIDGHLQFGDMAVMLKLQPRHTVVDAVSQVDRLDSQLVQQLMTTHEPSGLLVLPAPLEPTFADQITGQQMVGLIEIIKSFAGHVIVDLPAFFNDVVISILECSDDVVMVAGLDIPNIKNVKIGLATLAMLNINSEKVHLVLNRADSKVKLDVGEVEKTLGITAAAHVPSDVVVPISVNKGSPVVLSAAKSGVARAFEQLAGRFLDGVESEPVAAPSRRKFFG